MISDQHYPYEWDGGSPLSSYDDGNAYERLYSVDNSSFNEAAVIEKAIVASLVSASSFDGLPVPLREFHVPGMPAHDVTDLTGDGGGGKSLLALQLAFATATSTPWLGMYPRTGRVLYVSCEDDCDELHRRIASISAATGVPIGDACNLKLWSLAGQDAVLATFDRDGRISETAKMRMLQEAVGSVRPTFMVLDTRADLFGGDEIKRVEVRQFVGALRKIALEEQVTILMLSHPSLSGMSSGAGTGGSTAWNNSVRARWYLEPEPREKGEVGFIPDPDVRVLTTKKSNYGRVGQQLRLRWNDGVFTLDGDGHDDLQAARGREAERRFVEALAAYNLQGRYVSDATGRNFAPAMFAADKAIAGGFGKVAFTDAMNRLLSTSQLRVEMAGPPSRQVRKLIRTAP